MKKLNLSIKDLLGKDQNLTFLIGAGCSVDPPSCLPAGRQMMEAIIKYTCAESEREKILKLEDLRFEMLVEIIRNRLDEDLKLIDYYGQCNTPNLQHFFLAEMITNGQFVLTTNFDFLIEYALLQLGVAKDQIVPVITRNDFEKFANPNELLKQGKKPVYKIHGSSKNIITGENTRNSLIVTIRGFGSNKEGLNVFQIEPFKRALFDNISNGRSLVVMGYSGSDDFDIMPTLKILNNLKSLIWINHRKDAAGNEQISEIEVNDEKRIDAPDKINHILIDFKRMHNTLKVYRIDANTTKVIEKLIGITPKVSSSNFSTSPAMWLKNNIKSPTEFHKFFIPSEIYSNFDIYHESLTCMENMLDIAEKVNDLNWKSLAITSIGVIYNAQGKYPEALKRFEAALKIDEQLDDLSGKAANLNNIGRIYDAQGKYPEALNRYEAGLKIAEQLGDLKVKAALLTNIGEIYRAQGKYPEALNRYEAALKIAEQLGDLKVKAILLTNIGWIYHTKANYPEALNRYEAALKIAEQLGDLAGKTNRLNNIGEIYRAQGKYPEALNRYEAALKIAEQLGDLKVKAANLNNIGQIYSAQGKYPEALNRYEAALKIAEQLGDLKVKATLLTNIGWIYHIKGNYPEALKRYEAVLQIAEQLGDLAGKANRLNNIGAIYDAQGKYSEALNRYEVALQIAEQLGDLKVKTALLTNIGSIYQDQGKYPESLNRYEAALQIDEQLGDLKGKATRLNNIGTIYRAKGKYPEALKCYEEALKILNQLGLGDSPDAKIIKENIQKFKRFIK